MHVVIFCWEFPPRRVGQLADYVRELAAQLVKNKVETYVVTSHDYLMGQSEELEGVEIYRVVNPVRAHIGVLTWVLTLNQEVERAAASIYYDTDKRIDLIDVQDWHFIPAAVTLKKAFGLPFIYSVESLEDHRSHGANSLFNVAIKSIEQLGMCEAERIVVKSEWMRDEVIKFYKVSDDMVKVIQPGSSAWISDVLETYISVAEGTKWIKN